MKTWDAVSAKWTVSWRTLITLQPGANYTLDANVVTPDANFNGQLSVPATVSDGELTSAIFNLEVSVASVNDAPIVDTPIEDQTAIEDTPFTLDVSGNFSDPEGEPLSYRWTVLVRPPGSSAWPGAV